MHRIDGAGHVNNRFVTEDVATNRPPTEITADILNAVQEELVNLVLGSGQSLNKADNSQITEAIAIFLGVGQVSFFATQSPPPGWIKANGSLLLRADYQRLFNIIGTTFNIGGEDTSHFRVPDLRGNFIRAYDDGRGVDPQRVFGSLQSASAGKIDVSIQTTTVSGGSIPLLDILHINGHVFNDDLSSQTIDVTPFDAHPTNIALSAFIKY